MAGSRIYSGVLHPAPVWLQPLRKTAPLYLIFEKERALLVDTGAGKSDAAQVITGLVGKWAVRSQIQSVALLVAHSHGHADHTAGDSGFAGLANVTLVPAEVESGKKAFGIANWPIDVGSIDLGVGLPPGGPVPRSSSRCASVTLKRVTPTRSWSGVRGGGAETIPQDLRSGLASAICLAVQLQDDEEPILRPNIRLVSLKVPAYGALLAFKFARNLLNLTLANDHLAEGIGFTRFYQGQRVNRIVHQAGVAELFGRTKTSTSSLLDKALARSRHLLPS